MVVNLMQMGYRIPFSLIIFYHMAANTISYVTPGLQFGGEPLQIQWLACCHEVPAGEATASVVADRPIELICNHRVLMLMGLILLQSHYFNKQNSHWILVPIALISIAAAKTPVDRCEAS